MTGVSAETPCSLAKASVGVISPMCRIWIAALVQIHHQATKMLNLLPLPTIHYFHSTRHLLKWLLKKATVVSTEYSMHSLLLWQRMKDSGGIKMAKNALYTMPVRQGTIYYATYKTAMACLPYKSRRATVGIT